MTDDTLARIESINASFDTLRTERDAARAEAAALRMALEPFARLLLAHPSRRPDSYHIYGTGDLDGNDYVITIGDLRRARAALTPNACAAMARVAEAAQAARSALSPSTLQQIDMEGLPGEHEALVALFAAVDALEAER